MASPKATTIDFYHTQVTYASQLEDKIEALTEAEGGLSTLSLMDRILTYIPGEIYEGSSGELTPEIEKEDREMVQRWKEEADSTLIFVCASPTFLCIFPYEAHFQGRPVLSCHRNLPC